MKQEYLPIKLNETERRDLIDLARVNRSFYDVWRYRIDMTDTIFNELLGILHGKIKRNFCIVIKGGIGSQSGVFKSSLGCQLALALDPTFSVKERVSFTPNELIEKVKTYATQRQIFLMDERVRDFKMSAELRLANIIDATRERMLSFILIGIPDSRLTFSTYDFERMGESDDSYLNEKINIFGEEIYTGKKTVFFLAKKVTEFRKAYRGYFKWNITSLKDAKWRAFWEEYMEKKREHQQRAIESSLTGFNFKREAQNVIDDERFQNCYDPHGRMIKAKVKNLVYEMYPDNTAIERKMIETHICYPDKTVGMDGEL